MSLYEQMIQQFDGLVTLTNRDHKCEFTNNTTAKLFGFKDVASMNGTGPFEMRCPAVESANEFIKQFNYVFDSGESISVFDVHQYADGQQRVYITKKSPIMAPGSQRVTHVMTVCSEVSSQLIGQIFSRLKKQNSYFDGDFKNNVSYYVDFFPNKGRLSKRELECLYYLAQGKSAKEVGASMKISARTAQSYLDNIKDKLNVNSRSELVQYAINIGIFHYLPPTIFSQELTIVL